MEVLKKIGTTGNSATGKLFPDLPRTNKGWTEKTQVQFKLEGQGKPHVNKGKGLSIQGWGNLAAKKLLRNRLFILKKLEI
jgi:hypothetical protein